MANFLNEAAKKALESNIPFIRNKANETIIETLANKVEPRPRPFSMAGNGGEYTTWRGLTDRRFSGRQLPPAADEYVQSLPPMEDVVALFKREKEELDGRTSLLLPVFAQWFTDSFLRTKWQPPAEQDFAYNESNHEIDLNQIYGSAEEQTNMLRSMKGGRLKSQTINGEEWPVFLFDRETLPLQIKREFQGLYTQDNFERVFKNATDEHKRTAFAVGLEHGNSSIGNSTMNTLFLREHNRVAGVIAQAHPEWDDERVFQTTRNCLIVILIKVVIGDYIKQISNVPIFLPEPGFADKKEWYKTNWMSVEFALLYRWHDLIPSTFLMAGETRNSKYMKNNNSLLLETGAGQALIDVSSQKAGRLSLGNTPDFLQQVTKLSLTMARTTKLQPYVNYCKEYGLDVPKSFEDMTGEKTKAAKLEALYGSVDEVEWFVGLYAAERTSKDGFSSTMMTYMVANDAVTQALTNPLLHHRVYNPKTFSQEGFVIVEETLTMAQIIIRNTSVDDKALVGFPFDRE